MRPGLFLLVPLFLMTACGGLFSDGTSFLPNANRLVYDGLVTQSVKAGTFLPGTDVAYQGRAPDGRAILTIGGLQTYKATADSVNWTGVIVANSLVELKLRVLTFDAGSLNLAGTIHVVILDPFPQAGTPSPNLLASYTIPVQYTVGKNEAIPGTVVMFRGSRTEGAEFANLDQYPYRQQFDSVVWEGRLREKISLRLDLRVLNITEDAVFLGGTARLMFER